MATRTAAAGSTAEVARAYFEQVTDRDVEGMISFWEPGGIGHIHGVAELWVPEGYREWFGALFRGFPDLRFEVLDVLAEGEKAAVHWRARGTFNGDAKFEGLAPTGAMVDVQGCDVLTIRDGKVCDNQAYMSGTEMARQLGALPPAGSAQERGMAALVNARTKMLGLLRRRG